MPKKLLVTFMTAAMIVSAAGSYRFTISRGATVNGNQLEPGDYKIEMKGDTAVLKHDKQTVEVPARVETEPDKFPATTVRFADGNEIQQIGFGGTHTKIVFGAGSGTRTGGQ